eukprot:CAMPEP_0197233252 /NCGR_PEP_ID=MMETSP1429-20130617/1369_1 /TAXON_ID=49237 /ORGANISM="Chaetoceros  sp., Strain UNC1202" /LENGTH=102 /DNA_ID=CAMNT_0042691467 /DNA_START=157 /DNA_END=462 /DNA_ORIENTATION=+
MPGASQLTFSEFKDYDTRIVSDPCAKNSNRIHGNIDEGDGDVWVEKVLIGLKSGVRRTFFISKKTGRQVPDEPPTGASTVLYLTTDYKEELDARRMSNNRRQ